ncbi:MAG: hypothetical protein AAGF47_06865 [Planctomycetota bacterium]
MGNGTRLSSDIEAAAEAADISYRTALDAAKAVGIAHHRSSFGWYWRLPGEHPDNVVALIRDGTEAWPSASCELQVRVHPGSEA